MSDINDKIFAKNILKSMYPNLENIDTSSKTEKPDLHFMRNKIGVEVTKAWDDLDGMFYASLNGEIKNKEKLFEPNDMLLPNKIIRRIEDIDNIVNKISERIGAKTNLAPKYYNENPWMHKLYLFVIVDALLERYDLEKVSNKISNQTRKMFNKIFFATPKCIFIYNGWDFAKFDYR